MPFVGAVIILAILSGFASGALPAGKKPVDFSKLKQGQAIYKTNP